MLWVGGEMGPFSDKCPPNIILEMHTFERNFFYNSIKNQMKYFFKNVAHKFKCCRLVVDSKLARLSHIIGSTTGPPNSLDYHGFLSRHLGDMVSMGVLDDGHCGTSIVRRKRLYKCCSRVKYEKTRIQHINSSF